MTILSVSFNNRKRAFDVETSGTGTLAFPYAKLESVPDPGDGAIEAAIDVELGGEGFSYVFRSGLAGSVHVDQVLDYNRDPSYMKDLLVYKLTLEAQRRVAASPISKREMIRRLGTSATQLYRLLDQTNYRKSIDQLLRLLHLLGCDVELVVDGRRA